LRFKACIFFLLVSLAQLTALDGYGQIIPDSSLNHPIPPQARAQADTIHMYADTMKVIPVKPLPWEPKPKRAGLYSAILPGAGQIYNRQYWKLPIVYGGLGAGVYFIQDNRKQYRKYRQAYLYRIDNDPSTKDADNEIAQYSTENLRELQNEYRKNADLSVLLTAVGYAIHIMDAVASAHLRNFDISRDISLQMKPMLHSNGVGFGLAMNFK
jgi:hypothetical protein